MWGGFAIFWEASVLGIGLMSHSGAHHPAGGGSLCMILWGIPFVLVGLYIMVGRFFYDAASRRKTFYAVTDHRAIILKGQWSVDVMSFDFFTLGPLNLSERADGSGSILFGNPNPLSVLGTSGWPTTGRYTVPGFYLLPDAKTVFNLIRQAQAQARGR